MQVQEQEQDNIAQEDYYSDFARRVYFLAKVENWDSKRTMEQFNDRPGFEKYYANVSFLFLANESRFD